MARNLSEVNKSFRDLVIAHQARFKESVSVPHLVIPRDWYEELEEPPTTKTG
jgi:hypothetical protein